MLESVGDSSKSCKVEGFFFEDQYEGEVETQHQFQVRFEISAPTSTVHIQTSKVLKTMRKEYYVMTDIGLIGALGGTFGLFVGLSFLDVGIKTIDWAWAWAMRGTSKS